MLIDGTGGFQCAANFRTMEDALAGIGGTRPDVILTDIGLPGMDGIEGTRQLRERFPEVPVLALTVYDDDDKVFNAICAGASGYLLKNTPPARLLESLREVGMAARRCRRKLHGASSRSSGSSGPRSAHPAV